MKNNYYLSAILALIRVFLISVSFVLAKKLDGKISSMFLLLIRSLFCFFLLTPLFVKQGFKVVYTNKLKLHILRGVLGSAAMFCIYYSARQLPLALSSTISMSLPLFITMLSSVVLGEKIKKNQWLLLLLGYVGVMLSLNPFNARILNISVFISILANVFLALSIIFTKTLSKVDSAATIMFYYNLLLVLISIMFIGDSDIDITYNNILILFCIGLTSVLTQLCSIKSLSYSTPAFVAPFEYTRLVFAIPLGLMFFGEYPGMYTLVGALIIIYSNTMLARIKK